MQLKKSAIVTLEDRDAEFDSAWVYITDHPSQPSESCPIAQSYVDVVLSGCLDIGDEFAKEFIRTTSGWDKSWIDDRNRPRYRRSLEVDSDRIDALLREVIPDDFASRKLDHI